MKKTAKLQKYSAPALEKGLDILEFLSLTSATPTLSGIATGIGRTKSEIFRMMIVLEERDYIERLDGDCFRVTGKFGGIGSERTLNSRLAELSRPLLFALTEVTGLSSHLSVVRDGRSLVIANAAVPDSYGLSVQVGRRTDLPDTSVGACFMAADCWPRRDGALRPVFDPTAGFPATLFAEGVRDCEKHGYVVLPSPESQSILELSAPVRHLTLRKTIAAITIPFFVGRKVSNEAPMIVRYLGQCIDMVQEKICITLPNMQV